MHFPESHRSWFFLFLFTVFSGLFAATYFAQNVTLKLNEKSCRLNFNEDQVTATLALENTTSRVLKTHLKLELIDQNNRVRYRLDRDEAIKSGPSTLPLNLLKVDSKENIFNNDLLWYRLHYVLTSLEETSEPELEGFISASEITPDIFDLQVFAPQNAMAGTRYQARIRTSHPVTGAPINGVVITALAKYEINEKKRERKITALTGPEGYAVISLELPKDFGDDDSHNLSLLFTARKGQLERTEEIDLYLLQADTYIVTTDKTLYQPGQTIHARALIFDPQKRARADYEIDASIEDPEDQKTFHVKLKTTKFGVAFFDWPIPENARLGGYKIHFGTPSPTRIWGEAGVKISRYDLPTFAVKVKPDKTYYLPNENAEVEVKADYLFGQPVTKGSVKIVREADRQWNNKTYKYDVEEGETYRGDVDATGKFVAKIDLKKQHEEFSENEYRKFEDIHFAAYFTDVTTGRTEQRKFDLRLTKEAIHLYLIKAENYAPDEPIDCYVSASYADGSPARCEVAIEQTVAKADSEKDEQKLLTTVSTNKYGVAKLEGLRRIKSDDDDTNDVKLVLQARDDRGKTGKLNSEINIDDEPTIRIATDKSLYRSGESIKARIKTSVPTTRVVLEVLQNNRVVGSRFLDSSAGVTTLDIPYQADFKDDLTLVAYANIFDSEAGKDQFIYTSRAILYPRDRELKLEVKLPRTDFQPGEEVRADLSVRTADGKPVNSVLGAIVVDTAVGERERTDNEFRGQQSYYGFYYGDASLAGITRRDLDQIDLKQPIPGEYDLVAEILLNRENSDRIINHRESAYSKNQKQIFSSYFENQFHRVKSFLESEYDSKSIYPQNIAALKNLLHRINLDPEDLRDPWGTPYRIGFSTSRANDEMEIRSAGADKLFGTHDDFSVLNISRLYFRFTGEAINRAMANFQARTGDYVRDATALKNELQRDGINFDGLRDRWGTPYQIDFQKGYNGFYLIIRSAGPDRIMSTENAVSPDDIEVWHSSLDYFSDIKYRIEKALIAYEKATKTYPGDEAKFRAAMRQSNLNFDDLRDPLGHKFFAVVSSNSYYTNRTETITYSKYGEKPVEKAESIPITQTRILINIYGAGEDNRPSTKDDYLVTNFQRIVAEQSSTDQAPVQKIEVTTDNPESKKNTGKNSGEPAPPGLSGIITGKVTDPSGAIVANTVITATNEANGVTYTARNTDVGIYFLKGLPPGIYKVAFEAPGFKKQIVDQVKIFASKIVIVDAKLEVGGVTEAVMITGSPAQSLQTESASMSTIEAKQINQLPINGRNVMSLAMLSPGVAKTDISTPRLREYFPETLYWQPTVETDAQGRAALKFKLADNITTWRMSLIGSTVDGQIGTVEKDIRAFQPFFAELDPPKILTEGDEISLPIVLRNYLDKTQFVDLEFKPENWFTMLSPARKKLEVKPNDSANEVFGFRAMASIKGGKQRVTAIGSSASDAIEKTVTVHPDGEELAQTTSGILSERGLLEFNLPEDAIAGSARAELKIYPNLLAHVTEGIEGLLHRPYGCGEQTISSTYPNVMALRLLKSTGQGEAPHAVSIAGRARKFTRAGYERLLGYRDASGGFTYWGKGEPDLALTAYALRFLNDASDVIEVDKEIIESAQNWLFKQQSADGHWITHNYYGNNNDRQRSAMYTSLIARSLAESGNLSKDERKALQKSFDYLTTQFKEFEEPYTLANYALAAEKSGDTARANWAEGRLRDLAKEESGGIYWALETNTPFYGWGTAGRIETTALAIKALNLSVKNRKNSNSASSGLSSDALINKGVFWLLKNKDQYGVWLSTQATINVFEAFISLNELAQTSGEHQAEIFVNGRRATAVTMPASNQLVNPMTVNLSNFLSPGSNRVEIKRPANSALASAQAVETYYLPWSKSLATQGENFKPGVARALRLAVNFDKTQARIGEDILCQVNAERIGGYGYGMMLAEIGLPPGVDVDRASLENAAKEANWGINHYDVLPDRVILYLWPQAGGSKFNFKFKSRYGIKALNSASILYDYYNPEARAVIAPTRFEIK